MTRWMRILMLAGVLSVAGACGDVEPTGDGMGDGGGGGGGGGGGADPSFEAPTDGSFLSVCTPGDDTTCTDDYFCFEFNSKGPHCSAACVEDADCPEPSPGCNGMGVCKVP